MTDHGRTDSPDAADDRPAADQGSPAAPQAAGPVDPTQLIQLTYEQARTELAEVVERLEAGGCSLEEALALWERGEALARVCQRQLDHARARLEDATADPDVP